MAVEVVFVNIKILWIPRIRAALKLLLLLLLRLHLTLLRRTHIADFHIKLLALTAAEIDSEILRLHELQPIALICSNLRPIMLLLVLLIEHIRHHCVCHAILHNVHFIVVAAWIAIRFRVDASIVVVVVMVHGELARVVRRVNVRRVEHVEAMWIAGNDFRASNERGCCVRRGRWLATPAR